MSARLRPLLLTLALGGAELACAAPVEAPPAAPELAPSLHVEVLALRVRERSVALPSSAEPRTAFVSFLGGDEALARGVLEGLRDSAYMLGRARCSVGDPGASLELLARTEDFVLYAALLALVYEFERHEQTTGTQALAVLHRLAERMESTDTLFPSRELLTPEEVAISRGRRQRGPERSEPGEVPSMFEIYVEELFESSTSNRAHALKKERIAGRIAALREAISTLYLRERSDANQLCDAVEVLGAAAQDAWLWAAAADGELREAPPPGYELELELALSNVGAVESLAVLPRAKLRFEDAQGQSHEQSLELAQLREGGLHDNHVAPGFTLTRTLVGVSERVPERECQVALALSGGAGVEIVELELAACGAERDTQR